MITYKSPQEIEAMKHGGAILKEVLNKAIYRVQPGITTKQIDNFIDAYITSKGAEPGFKRVKGYAWASCICVNDQIVHTPPSDRVIKDGDVVTVDTGVFYDGLHTDAAFTVQAGQHTQRVQRFLEVGQEALNKALKVAIKGKRVGDISREFQTTIENSGYSIVKGLTGHGVGKELHESPFIPCFLDQSIDKTPLLASGMTLALEVMYCMGSGQMVHEADNWSIKTADNSLAASFEHTVAITENGSLILT